VTIRLSDVHFSYAAGTPWERKVLRGVSLKAGPGRCLGILGGNGSGKTTLVRHMNGLLLPQEGTVQVGDITLGKEMKRPPLLAGRVGLVFQFPEKQLFGETVLEDVALGLRFSGSAPEEAEGRAVEALRKVGVDPARYAARSPFSLNWGEKRKVAIAGVLALETPRVIFDEPGAGLDPAGRRHLLGLIRDLVDEGKTVVHDGKVVFRGSLEGLCRRESLRQWGLQWPPLIRTVKIAAGEKEDVKTAVRTPEEAAQVLRTLQRS
jgi:energy-coupling factor transport system ATP-binding protein